MVGDTMSCPCDSCVYKSLNYQPHNKCPNFDYFFDAFMNAFDGVLKEDECPNYKAKENKRSG